MVTVGAVETAHLLRRDLERVKAAFIQSSSRYAGLVYDLHIRRLALHTSLRRVGAPRLLPLPAIAGRDAVSPGPETGTSWSAVGETHTAERDGTPTGLRGLDPCRAAPPCAGLLY
jgi:hypothetical protein